MWGHLHRQGLTVARCTVERLMRANGWRGVTRARTTRTTIPDLAQTRAPDLVRRNFTADRPGQLHVADFTYVPLDGGGSGYTAFVIDAFAGLIAGWECSLSKETGLRGAGDQPNRPTPSMSCVSPASSAPLARNCASIASRSRTRKLSMACWARDPK